MSHKKELYDKEKLKLPAVIFGASFPINEKRQGAKFSKYNNLVVVDIDKLDNKELSLIKENLETDEYIHAFWLSPSGKGYKGLVWIDYEIEVTSINFESYHRIAFSNLVTYFQEQHGIELDKSGSDIVRLCFYSYDPNLIIKETIKKFPIRKEDLCSIEKRKPKTIRKIANNTTERNILYNPLYKNLSKDRTKIQTISKYLNKRGLSITYKYDNWFRVAFAIANSFTFDIGKKYFIKLSEMDKKKFNEEEAIDFLLYAYKNNKGKIRFNTIIFLAKNVGFRNGESTEDRKAPNTETSCKY